MISYTMTNYVKLYYDILNYTLLRSLINPRYLVNSAECSMQKTPRGGKIIGPHIYIYIYIYIYICEALLGPAPGGSSAGRQPHDGGAKQQQRQQQQQGITACKDLCVFAPPFFRAPFPCLNVDTLFSE